MLSTLCLTAALLTGVVHADLGKNVLFPEGLHDPLIGLDSLPAPGGSYYGVDTPQSCIDRGSELGCNTANIQAVAITYDDCSEPWTICRCDNANLDLQTVFRRFATVPVGLRSYVGTVLATQADNANAYNAGGFVAINGDCDVSVFIHESSHSLDQGVSTGSQFENAIASSSCVPDGYADTNEVEDFAQVSVVYTYQKLVGALDRDASCMQPQLDVFASTQRLNDDLTATSCNPSVRPSTNKVSSAKFKGTSTGEYIAAKPESTMDAVRAFQKKYGTSRNAYNGTAHS